MPVNYYNDNEKFVTQWLRNLISHKLIPDGNVDDRPIQEVKADDLQGYTQCHFFAGIAGWSEALRLAGWPSGRPVWTGSCPCQPFSAAGRQGGISDERHLWPIWFNLIKVCRPPVVFGEQVASAIAYGWLDAVFDDLEAEGYSCGAVVLPACSVGAPHIRQRLWWYANTDSKCNILQRWTDKAENQKHETESGKQLSGLLQSHSWPTLSDSKLWAGAYGIPKDVAICHANKAIGNSIVPQIAAAFIMAVMDE